MNPIKHKLVRVTSPAAIVDNASLTCQVTDTKGYAFARYVFYFGAMDIAATALKIQESDATSSATALSSGADVTGAIYGTSTNDAGSASTLPSATDDNGFYTVEIDLKGRKRYLNPVVTLGDGAAGTYIAVWCELHKGDNVPTSATQKGATQNLRVPVIS
jgi:hypothetical protein